MFVVLTIDDNLELKEEQFVSFNDAATALLEILRVHGLFKSYSLDQHNDAITSTDHYIKYKDLTWQGLCEFAQILHDNGIEPSKQLVDIAKSNTCEQLNEFVRNRYVVDNYLIEYYVYDNSCVSNIKQYIMSEYGDAYGIAIEVYNTLTELKRSIIDFGFVTMINGLIRYAILTSRNIGELHESIYQCTPNYVHSYSIMTIDRNNDKTIYN